MFSPTSYFSWKKRKKRIFLRKEAKKRNFKRKEEKEEKEAEWDASLEIFLGEMPCLVKFLMCLLNHITKLRLHCIVLKSTYIVNFHILLHHLNIMQKYSACVVLLTWYIICKYNVATSITFKLNWLFSGCPIINGRFLYSFFYHLVCLF